MFIKKALYKVVHKGTDVCMATFRWGVPCLVLGGGWG